MPDDLSGMVEEFERSLHRRSHEEHDEMHGADCRHPKYQGRRSIECPQCYEPVLPKAWVVRR